MSCTRLYCCKHTVPSKSKVRCPSIVVPWHTAVELRDRDWARNHSALALPANKGRDGWSPSSTICLVMLSTLLGQTYMEAFEQAPPFRVSSLIPRPVRHFRLHERTASDEKLGGAWGRGYRVSVLSISSTLPPNQVTKKHGMYRNNVWI